MPNKAPEIEKLVFPSECAKRLGCGVGLVSAVKRVLGITRKKVFPSEIYKYLRANPNFTMSSAYPKKTAVI